MSTQSKRSLDSPASHVRMLQTDRQEPDAADIDAAFNAALDNVPAPLATPLPCPSSDAAAVANVAGSCLSLSLEAWRALDDEALLLQRILYRARSQHRNSVHFRCAQRLATATSRVKRAGLSTILSSISASAPPATAASGAAAHAAPREAVELATCRCVATAALCHRGERVSLALFHACELLCAKALFMPLAVTLLAIAARVRALLVAIRHAAAEAHLRLAVVRDRAPPLPSSADAAAGAAGRVLICWSKQRAFDQQLAELQRLTGDAAPVEPPPPLPPPPPALACAAPSVPGGLAAAPAG